MPIWSLYSHTCICIRLVFLLLTTLWKQTWSSGFQQNYLKACYSALWTSKKDNFETDRLWDIICKYSIYAELCVCHEWYKKIKLELSSQINENRLSADRNNMPSSLWVIWQVFSAIVTLKGCSTTSEDKRLDFIRYDDLFFTTTKYEKKKLWISNTTDIKIN